MSKFGRLTDNVAVVEIKTGKASSLFSRYWADLCAAVERLQARDATGPSKLDSTYVGGAPAATGYALIEINGVTYKVLLST